jgi:type IV fimbrial biogenesis protein FimT
MKSRGLTLIELLITLSIASIVLAIALPSFSKQIEKAHTETSAKTFADAIETARSQAVFRNQRTVLLPKREWHLGWTLFVDADDDGIKDAGEVLILENAAIEKIKINDNFPGAKLISFIGSGEGRQPGRRNRGAIIMGSMTICPKVSGEGIKLSLNRAGRLRSEKITYDECI